MRMAVLESDVRFGKEFPGTARIRECHADPPPAQAPYTGPRLEDVAVAVRRKQDDMMRTVKNVAMGMAAAAVFYAVATTPTGGSSQREIAVDIVNQPRPVALAVRQVEKQLGYVVTYEDTVYRFPGDIVDVSKQMRGRDPSLGPYPGMRSGTLQFRHSPRASTLAGRVEEVLQEIVARSRRIGNIGDFRVESTVNGYHVVPVQAKNRNGVEEPYESPLESRITMESRDESAADMIRRFVGVVSQASGQPLVEGLMPGRFHGIRVTVDAQNDRARDVLWRALQSVNAGLSWQLLCGPDGPCALNIHAIALAK